MNINNRLKEFLVIYNKLQEIKLQCSTENPLFYFADYKAQLYKDIVQCLTIYKFDYCTKDYKFIGTVFDIHKVLVCHSECTVFDNSPILSSHNNDIGCIISKIGNMDSNIRNNITKDEYFNYSIGYDIKLTFNEVIEYLSLASQINHTVHIHMW